MLTLLLAAAVVAGYLTGRVRPARRISDWAAWQSRPTSVRFAAVYTIRSIENIGWLLAHPVQGWRTWRARNDPPPRSPAVQLVTPWPPEDPR
ncbi:hypothetical protein ACWCYZ_16800 [Streptomyces virginiae]